MTYAVKRINYIIIDFVAIVLCVIIGINAYYKLYDKNLKYSYIIKPTRFIKKLAIYGMVNCIFTLVFKLYDDIYVLFSNSNIRYIVDVKAIINIIIAQFLIFALFFYFWLIISSLQLQRTHTRFFITKFF